MPIGGQSAPSLAQLALKVLDQAPSAGDGRSGLPRVG